MSFKFYVFDVPSSKFTGGLLNYTDTLRVASGKWFLVRALTGTQTGIYALNIIDTFLNRYWFNFPAGFGKVNNVNVIGTAQYPFILDHPAVLPPASTITFILDEKSGSPNTVQIVLLGEEIDSAGTIADRSFIGYCIERSLSANQRLEDNFTIRKMRNFVFRKITGNATSTSAKINFSYGRYLGSIRGNWNNLVGTAQRPCYLPVPQTFKQDSIVIYDLEDTSGSANTLQLCLWGYESLK